MNFKELTYKQFPLQKHYKHSLNLTVWSADDFCEQIGPRSGLIKLWSWYGSNLFDTRIVFLKEFFEKVDFDKNQQTTKEHLKYFQGGKELCNSAKIKYGNTYEFQALNKHIEKAI